MPTSKTARRSSPKLGANASPEDRIAAAATSGSTRITPLNGGKHCYVSNPVTGKNPHVATNSAAFDEIMAELGAVPAMRARLLDEMNEYAARWPTSEWSNVVARLTATGGPLSDEPADAGDDS